MRMGNLLSAGLLPTTVMAASKPRLGIAHPTVVPGERRADGDGGAQTEQAASDEQPADAEDGQDA